MSVYLFLVFISSYHVELVSYGHLSLVVNGTLDVVIEIELS